MKPLLSLKKMVSVGPVFGAMNQGVPKILDTINKSELLKRPKIEFKRFQNSGQALKSNSSGLKAFQH